MKTKITCIERKYKVETDSTAYIISAKRELNEDVTGKLLHEDMELKTFLDNYEIVPLKENEIKVIEKKEDRSIEKKEDRSIEKRPVLAKLPSTLQREWIIMHNMPEEFALEDIIKFYKERNEHYDLKTLKGLVGYSLQHLKKCKMIEIINPEVNRRYRKYRIIANARNEYDKMVKDLKEGQKVLLGTIR